jgi:hypothetical protein
VRLKSHVDASIEHGERGRRQGRGGRAHLVARWSIPSIGNYCMLLVLYLLVANSWRFLIDSDTGWHIRTGDWILQHRQVPQRDVFSYTMAGHAWFAWEWLADVSMSMIHAARGLGGVVGAAVLLLTITYGALFRVMIWRGTDPLTAFAVTLFATLASMIHWLARPHLFSIPLMIAWCLLVERHRRTGTRWIYAVPALILLWANLHGSFVVTFAMLLIYAAGGWLESAQRGEAWSRATRRTLGTYALVGVLSAIAAIATPYGVRLYGHLWRFASDEHLLAGIQDFRSPDFHLADGKLIELLLLLGALAAMRAAVQRRFVEAGLVLLWAHLTLQSERHVTLAAVVISPLVAEHLSQGVGAAVERASRREGRWGRWWGAARSWHQGMTRADRQVNGVTVYTVTLGFLLIATCNGSSDKWLPTNVSPRRFPIAAVDFIAGERKLGRLRGNLYAHDQYGGYLLYRLYPDVRVFVDGRNDLYAQGTILDEMTAVSNVEPSWSDVLDKHQVEWMLAPRDRPLSLMARMSGGWKAVYEDPTAQVLVRMPSRSTVAAGHH